MDIPNSIIYNEDCICGLKKLPDHIADLIICDPPYNIGKDFGNDSDKQDMDDYLKWCNEWIIECFRLLKPKGTMYIYGFSENPAFIRTLITHPVRWIIWQIVDAI